MKFGFIRPAKSLVCLLGAQLALTSPVQASAGMLVNSNLLVALQSMGNICVGYSYDQNGNITARSNLTYGAQGTWGTAVFGCFTWASP